MVETREGGAPGTQVGAHDQAAGSGAGGRRRLVPPWGEAGGLSLGREGGAAHIGQATVPCVRSDEQTDPPRGESVPGRDRTGPRDPSGTAGETQRAQRAPPDGVTEVALSCGRGRERGSQRGAGGTPSRPSQTLPGLHLVGKTLQRQLERGLSRVKDP